MDYTEMSKFLALVLRHKPEKINIKLDKYGWANVDEIIKGMKISVQDLEYIVENDNKKRYSFNNDKSKIRANQGHSIKVDVQLKKSIPPVVLYHGTKKQFLPSIYKQGLKPMNRLYVHLSNDIDTAKKVADRRKGESVILLIDSKSMLNDNIDFYLSENNVWLVEYVCPKYIKELK